MESRDVIGGAEINTLGKMNRWVEEYSMQTRIKFSLAGVFFPSPLPIVEPKYCKG